MKTKSIVLLFSFTLVNHLLIAQSGSITGSLSSSNNNDRLAYVSIGIEGSNIGTTSDEEGFFKLENIPYGKHTLIAGLVGYTKFKRVIHVNQSELTLNITLSEANNALDEVVISGSMKEVSKLESPVAIEVYAPSFFQANPTPSIFESMQNINGVRPQLNCNVCNTGDIHINGLEGPYTMVLIDGMPIVSGLSTVYGLTGIPQSLIERVEIVKGPASTLYGSEAVGGLVNVITKKPENVSLVSTDVMASNWREINADLGIKYNMGSKAQSLIGINYFNYQNPIDNNGDNFTDMTLQNRISIFDKIQFKRKNNRQFSIAGRYVFEDRWGGEMQWTPEDRGGNTVYGESIFTNRWEMFGIYQLPFEEVINLQVSANGHDQNSYYGDLSFDAQQYIGFAQLTWHKSIGANQELLVGTAYRYTFYNDNTTATEDASITSLPGVFIQDELSINEQHKLLIGMRYDYNSIHGNILSPRLNYKWNSFDKKTVLRLSVGNGYRVANVFTEDHAALTGARDVVFEDELLPERSWNTNLNFVKKILTSNGVFIGIDASAFYTYFDNRIVPDYETNPTQIIYANLDGHAVSQGVSVNTDISWKSGLSVLGGITFMDVTLTENGEKNQQLLTERFSGVWNIGYTFGSSLISIDYTGNVYGPMRLPLLGDTDPRPEYSPWFSVQNIQVTKKFTNGLQIYGGVKNLLNFTPASNSIARSHDPFDNLVNFVDSTTPDSTPVNGDIILTGENPYGLTFDPTYVYASNQGIRGFLGIRYSIR